MRDEGETLSASTPISAISAPGSCRETGSGLPTPPLVGRQTELLRIKEVLGDSPAGRARFLELVGEPGIGKTRLLDEIAESLADRVVLRARAAQLEREIPFALYVGALDDHLASLNLRFLERLPTDQAAELAEVFPALADLAESRPATPSEERYRTHRAVRGLLELIGSVKPVVVALDDLHWADDASLELTEHLLRHPPRAPVTFALAHRSGILPARWQAALDAGIRDAGLVRIELGPISPSGARVLASSLKPELARRAYELAGGNPFYLQQLAARPESLAANPSGGTAGMIEGVPEAVQAALRDELAALGERTRIALQGAAVAGDPFDLDLASAAAEIDQAELLASIDQATAMGVVVPTAAPRQFRFRHPIVALAVYESASPGWRIAAHTRLAAVLSQRGAGPLARSHHVEQAARAGDADAIEVLTAAANDAAARDPAAAARWFGAALRLLPEGPEADEQRLALLVLRARMLAAAGRLTDSRVALREAIAAMPAEALDMRIEATVACSLVDRFLSRHEEARISLQELLNDPGLEAGRRRATVLGALAGLAAMSDQWEDAYDFAGQALASAREVGHPVLECVATSVLASQALRVADLTEARAMADHAAGLIDPLTDAQLAERLEAVAWLCQVEFLLERTDQCIRHADRGLEVARATGQTHLLPQLMLGRSWSLYWLGRVADARAAFEETIEVAHLTGNKEFGAFAQAGYADLAVCWAEPQEVSRLAREAIALAEVSGPQTTGYASAFAARALLEVGEFEAARDQILEGCGGADLPAIELFMRPMGWSILTRCEVERGDLAASDECARRAEAVADALPLNGCLGWAREARAHVELACGNPAAAAEAALAAAEGLGRMRIGVASLQILAAGALVEAGEEERAVALFERAQTDLDRCGATRFRDRASQGLRKLGRRVGRPAARPATNGAAELSEREREVAALVADGRTNREIGAALFISPKTVEKHLARVFVKLGVRNRSAVGARLAELGETRASSG